MDIHLNLNLFAFFVPGGMQLAIIALIVFLLFGNRVPNMMKSLGSGLFEFKKGLNDLADMPDDIDKANARIEREKAKAKETGR